MRDGLRKGHEQGLQQGREQGLQQGLQQGREEGREEGRTVEQRRIVQAMREKGLTDGQIASFTGIAEDVVADL